MPSVNKKLKQAQQLAELLGLEAPTEESLSTGEDTGDDVSREAEAAIAYYDSPANFAFVTCKECQRGFRVSRANVNYCSDACRKSALLSRGLVWKPLSSKQKFSLWNDYKDSKGEPLIVEPAVVEIIDSARDNAPRPTEESDGCPVGEHTYEQGCEFFFL